MEYKNQNRAKNIAFIDGQNLYLGAKEKGWSVDHKRLRIYLADKYCVAEAYYFLGFISDTEQGLYQNLQKAGFILSFREHSSALKSQKKGNVDSDIIFEAMRVLVEEKTFSKIFIVSGDGDYKKLVDFLIKKGKFGKILFPNKEFVSSLYKSLGSEFLDDLGSKDIRTKIEYRLK